jgi:hypothetical protein
MQKVSFVGLLQPSKGRRVIRANLTSSYELLDVWRSAPIQGWRLAERTARAEWRRTAQVFPSRMWRAAWSVWVLLRDR